MTYRLRSANEHDAAAISAIAHAAYAPYVERIGREPAPMVADFSAAIAVGHVTVAEDKSEHDIPAVVCGYVIAYARGVDEMHLENVAVAPKYHGQGIGQLLITHVEDAARNAGLGRVVLYTNAAMTENLALYPRLGYHQTHRNIEDGFDRVYFKKLIVPAQTT